MPFLNLPVDGNKFFSSKPMPLLRVTIRLGRAPLLALVSISLAGESHSLGGAQSCLVQSNNAPTYVLPRQVTLTTKIPGSVSCHTIPSKVTLVPGSQGPRQSGSVLVPILVDVPHSFVDDMLDAGIVFAPASALSESSHTIWASTGFALLLVGDF